MSAEQTALPFDTTAPVRAGRRTADYYPTPANVWRPFVPVLTRRLQQSRVTAIVEPACGDGRLMTAMRDLTPLPLVGFDVRPEAVSATRAAGHVAHCCDWLTSAPVPELPDGPLAIITNPPFRDASAFAETCLLRAGLLDDGEPGGLVALLVRLTWLEPTRSRATLLTTHPADVWVCPERGRFANGQTDTATTAWVVWPPADPLPGPGSRLRWLGHHPPT